ncbi:MAG: 4-alpha-glucanotransferase [Oscillospiraceae bacterium]|nr:4-alpha-glucanotransferase [Oscillospiraceae bacterium]
MRGSGILMHITSLPGPYGIGTMGAQAYQFIDFLKAAGQKYWQILPLTPTGYGDSPYQSCSTFAGNHYLIDLDMLVEAGLLERDEIRAYSWGENPNRVDFGLQYQNRLQVLRLAYDRFRDHQALDAFCRENAGWLPDYTLFMALKDRFAGLPWYNWEDNLKHRDPDAIWKARQELSEQIRFYCFVQYLFFCQWQALCSYAHKAGVQIIGDVPIYVPYDSVDVWSDPELFLLDEELTPIEVAGCPPDCFSEEGQLWGNPLYRWERHKKDGYSWWIRRMQGAASRYDGIRIDHFRGFAGYWAVPYGDATARNGQWLPGPGMDFIRALHTALPDVQMIAEDLGLLTPDVHKLRDDSGYPGMKVLSFAFDGGADCEYLPHTYHRNTVCYTGTHDNMPIKQWLAESSPKAVAFALEYAGGTEDPVWSIIRLCLSSVSDLAVVQIQDYLELGAEGRMNFPGTRTGDNWTWRADPQFVSRELAERIWKLTATYGRL